MRCCKSSRSLYHRRLPSIEPKALGKYLDVLVLLKVPKPKDRAKSRVIHRGRSGGIPKSIPVRVACVRGSGESPERRLNGRKLTPRRQGLAREGWSIGSLW
jgi:hypothetical protein